MSGKLLSPIAPYGYKKSEHDKDQWVIDEETASVVRKILVFAYTKRFAREMREYFE